MRPEDLVFALLLTAATSFHAYYGGWNVVVFFFLFIPFSLAGSAEVWTWLVLPFVWGATSLCAMSTEESGVKEELGRPSLADSSLSLSVFSAGLSLLVGLFIETEYVFICTYPTLSRLTQKASDTPKLVTPVSLTEGRQICPTQQWVFFPSLCWFVGYFSLDVNSLVWTLRSEKNKQSRALQAGSFWKPQIPQGKYKNTLQRDGQASILRSSVRLAWSGLGSIWNGRRAGKEALFDETYMSFV